MKPQFKIQGKDEVKKKTTQLQNDGVKKNQEDYPTPVVHAYAVNMG